MLFKKNKGFTLIELLTVVAIIGLIGALVIAAIGRRRIRDRDVRRMADFAQFQKSLDLAFANANAYPPALTGINLGDPAHDVLCGKGKTSNFVASNNSANCDADKVYVGIVPRDPGTPGFEYVYKTYAGGGTYCIQTTLEVGGVGNYNAGPVSANQNSVTNTTCP